MFDFAFIYATAVIVIMTLLLVRDGFEPDIVIFSALVLLILGDVVTVHNAFVGFSIHSMLTVLFLCVVAAALRKTGILDSAGERIFAGNGNMSFKLARFLYPVATISAFFNNTPIVAMFIPALRSAARKSDHSVSKFMIPLSYASILGMCTLIGASTTLVIHGLMIESELTGFGFFEISKIGVPLAVAGVFILSFGGHHLLPDRKTPIRQLDEQTREFVIEMKVESNYKHIGKTVADGGLRHLKGLYLFQIQRGDETLSNVGPDEIIELGDRLFFTGQPDTILVLQRTPGLSSLKDVAFDLKSYDSDKFGIFKVVVSENSPLSGKNVCFSQFRSRDRAVILAIHRSAERILQKIGDMTLKAGDTLLILVAVTLASMILILSKTISPNAARRSVTWSVLLVIASAFGIARAMVNLGVAEFMANQVMHTFGVLGPIGLLVAIYVMTSKYTIIITTNAVAASASFASPISYQTNLMVYGPGGFKFSDFLKIGVPMNISVGMAAAALISFYYF